MKDSLDVLRELKEEYKKTLPAGMEMIHPDHNFAVYLTECFVVNASFIEDYVITSLLFENSREIDDYLKRFKGVMEKILGFPPYCWYHSLTDKGITFVWIEKNHQEHYDFFARHKNIFYFGLTKF